MHRSVRDDIGHSFWVVYGLLFDWVRKHYIMFSVPHEVSALLRVIGARGLVFVAVVGFCMLWGCVIHVRGDSIVLHRGLLLFCSVGSKGRLPLCYVLV